MPQSAFIYNATVRENILFGLPFDQQRYAEAIKASAVGPDIDNMPGESSLTVPTSLLLGRLGVPTVSAKLLIHQVCTVSCTRGFADVVGTPSLKDMYMPGENSHSLLTGFLVEHIW